MSYKKQGELISMLIPNVCQLDQLPFLKRPHFKWKSDQQQQGQKSKIKLLQNLRCLSYQNSELMAKIFLFEKQTKKDTSNMTESQNQPERMYEQLVVTTQKEILTLQKFFYLVNDVLPHEDFSHTVSLINSFVNQCKTYLKDMIYSKYEIDFGNKEFLSFGIYLQKQAPDSLNFKNLQGKELFQKFMDRNKFYVKCSISNYSFEPFKEIIQVKAKKPDCFIIQNILLIERLIKIYLEMSTIILPIKLKQVKNYVSLFDQIFHYIDEQYLKLQIIKNYPLLRSKFYLPVKFNDRITSERLDGPIFSNADPDCMFSHLVGYNADTVKILEGNNCQECRSYFEGVQQNPILSHLRDNLFNPLKTDVFFCPEFNRFKLIVRKALQKSQNVEEDDQSEESSRFKTQIKYLNYLHMRLNLRKIYTKRRNKFNDMLEYERFPLTFNIWGKRLLIMDPARGKNCSHYEFTDLRCFYLNKVTQSTFRCPICGDVMSDNDILYLKEVQILIKYLKFKCSQSKQLALRGICTISHRNQRVFIEFKQRNKANKEILEQEIVEVKKFYETLIDPYVSFNQYALEIPSKYEKKIRERYLFGLDKPNQEKDSDEQFQYRDIGIDIEHQLKSQKGKSSEIEEIFDEDKSKQ